MGHRHRQGSPPWVLVLAREFPKRRPGLHGGSLAEVGVLVSTVVLPERARSLAPSLDWFVLLRHRCPAGLKEFLLKILPLPQGHHVHLLYEAPKGRRR